MIRILTYLAIIIVLGLSFAWLADRPGEMVAVVAGQRYKITIITAVALIIAIVAAVMLTWWFTRSIIQSPASLNRHFRARKRDRGYQSLSTGLIAAGSGDTEAARRMTKQAAQLLNADQEPLIKLLQVQTAMLEGRTDDARAGFEAMVEDPETKLLGLRGLFIEAQRSGQFEKAHIYAAEAVKTAPQLEWASSAVLGQLSLNNKWDEALRLVDARKNVLHHSKDIVKRERAALLTAKAIALLDTQPLEARSIALQAHKLNPDLIPASIIAAKALFAQNEIRKGSKILEKAWVKEPHPDIAATYIHARSGDTAADRLKRAKYLVSLRPNNVESSLALAHAAYEANEFKLAREKAQEVLNADPRESAYLLMADIEEADGNDQGRVKSWLSKALQAPRDPCWTADGVTTTKWAPASPVTGRLNAFEWKKPTTKLGSIIEVPEAEIIGDTTTENNKPEPVVVIPAAEVVKTTQPEQAKQATPNEQVGVSGDEPSQSLSGHQSVSTPTSDTKQDKLTEEEVSKPVVAKPSIISEKPLLVDDPGVEQEQDDDLPQASINPHRIF